jgi:hypothetical protein
VLNIGDNPALSTYQLKQLPSLQALRALHMRNTHRTDNNVPELIDSLVGCGRKHDESL